MSDLHWCSETFAIQRDRALRRQAARKARGEMAKTSRRARVAALASTLTRLQLADEIGVTERTIRADLTALGIRCKAAPHSKGKNSRAKPDEAGTGSLMKRWGAV